LMSSSSRTRPIPGVMQQTLSSDSSDCPEKKSGWLMGMYLPAMRKFPTSTVSRFNASRNTYSASSGNRSITAITIPRTPHACSRVITARCGQAKIGTRNQHGNIPAKPQTPPVCVGTASSALCTTGIRTTCSYRRPISSRMM